MMSTIDAFFKPPSKVETKAYTESNLSTGKPDEYLVNSDGKNGLDDSMELFEDPKPFQSSGKKTNKDYTRTQRKTKSVQSEVKTNGNHAEDNKVDDKSPQVVKDEHAESSSKVTFMTYEDLKREIVDESISEKSKCTTGQTKSELNTPNECTKDSSVINDVSTSKMSSPETALCDATKAKVNKFKDEKEVLEKSTKEGSHTTEAIKSKPKKRIKPLMLKAFDDTKGKPDIGPHSPHPNDEDEILPLPTKPVQTNSLFQYFSKSSKSSCPNPVSNQPVKIKVEIHKEPAPQEKPLAPSKVFGIFCKPPKQSPSPTEALKRTPTSNVVVDSQVADMSIVELETSLDVSPIKRRRKAAKCLVLSTTPVKAKHSEDLTFIEIENSDSLVRHEINGVTITNVDEDTQPYGVSETFVNTMEPEPTVIDNDCDKLDSGICTSDDEKIAQLERKMNIHAQMESLEKVVLPVSVKSTQMTLCFGKRGFSVQKPAKKGSEEKETSLSDGTNHSKHSKKTAKNTESRIKMKKKADKNVEVATVDLVEESNEAESHGEQTGAKTRTPSALESIYKSSLAKHTSKGRAPIKLRLRR